LDNIPRFSDAKETVGLLLIIEFRVLQQQRKVVNDKRKKQRQTKVVILHTWNKK
jgi:hypothetical protein